MRLAASVTCDALGVFAHYQVNEPAVGLFFTNSHARKMAHEAAAVTEANTLAEKGLEDAVRDARKTVRETELLGGLSAGFADRMIQTLERVMEAEGVEVERKGPVGGMIQSFFNAFKK